MCGARRILSRRDNPILYDVSSVPTFSVRPSPPRRRDARWQGGRGRGEIQYPGDGLYT